MSQNPDDIESALRQAFFEAIPGAEPKTVMENVATDVAGQESYYIFTFLPATPSVATLGNQGTDAFSGLVQLDYNILNGKGKGDSEAVFKTLRDYFTAGKRLLYNNVSVTVISSGRTGRGRQVGSHYRFSFEIRWESRIRRN